MAEAPPSSTDQNKLPPPGPVYIISETGYGPQGLFDKETESEAWQPLRRLRDFLSLSWLSEINRKAERSNDT